MLITMTSCLKHDLDEVESSKLCDISSVEFEYRWTKEIINSEGKPTGVHELYYKGIEVNATKDEANHKISIKMTVPMPNGNFTNEIRQQVSLERLVGMFTVSTAASVVPLNGAPVLGKQGDFSQKNFTYRVVAPSGDYKDWEIDITEFSTDINLTSMVWSDGYDAKTVSGHTGDRLELKVGLSPEIATNKTLKWEIADENIATIDQNGLLSMVGAGYTTLKVSTTDASGLYLERRIAVDFIPVTSIQLNKSLIAMDLQTNRTITLEMPTIVPDNAMIQDLEWKVENESVATFDPATFTLTAVAAGTTKLTVTALDGFEARATATIIVTEEPEEEPEPYVYIKAVDFTGYNDVGTTPKNTPDTDMKNEIPTQIESIGRGAYMTYGNNPIQMAYYNYITLRASTETKGAGVVTIHLDAADGPVVATVNLTATNSWSNFQSFIAPLDLSKVNLAKKHTLHLAFSNTDGNRWICNLHYIKLGVDMN